MTSETSARDTPAAWATSSIVGGRRSSWLLGPRSRITNRRELTQRTSWPQVRCRALTGTREYLPNTDFSLDAPEMVGIYSRLRPLERSNPSHGFGALQGTGRQRSGAQP